MSLNFVSCDIIEIRTDVLTGKTLGKVLVYYRREDAHSYLEHEMVNVSCLFSKEKPKWKIRQSVIDAAKSKMLHLETAFPETIDNIFVV